MMLYRWLMIKGSAAKGSEAARHWKGPWGLSFQRQHPATGCFSCFSATGVTAAYGDTFHQLVAVEVAAEVAAWVDPWVRLAPVIGWSWKNHTWAGSEGWRLSCSAVWLMIRIKPDYVE